MGDPAWLKPALAILENCRSLRVTRQQLSSACFHNLLRPSVNSMDVPQVSVSSALA
jgi:hypothetical protein